MAWKPSTISPWLAAPTGLSRRTWADRVPLWGWFRLRRESHVHGRAFWIRPLLVELLTAVGCLLLYWLEVRDAGLLPGMAAIGTAPADQFATANLAAVTHWSFASHLVLILLMAVASLIDIDEQLIPDAITVPGTLIGLLFAVIYLPTIRSEEAYLREHFAGFEEYAAKVPRLLPRLTAAEFPAHENASGGRFSAMQWRHHREYNALMGAGAIYLALAVRLFLHRHGAMGGLR